MRAIYKIMINMELSKEDEIQLKKFLTESGKTMEDINNEAEHQLREHIQTIFTKDTTIAIEGGLIDG